MSTSIVTDKKMTKKEVENYEHEEFAEYDNETEDDNSFFYYDSSADERVLLVGLFVVVTSCKALLFPSYYSTDLAVHRHWKAVTRHLPWKEWYWDDRHVDTRHTLDYPPLFAMFEYGLANNPLTQWLLDSERLDQRCLALLPDSDNLPSSKCIAFLRSTVLVSDVVLWWGAWRLVSACFTTIASPSSKRNKNLKWITFLFIVCNPGLLWLDHVHFQYNGMLLGVLLLSLSYLLQSAAVVVTPNNYNNNHMLVAAVLYALLLNLKHLYLTLGLWYLCYLFRAYCFVDNNSNNNNNISQFQPRRLFVLGGLTILTLLTPWLPFLFESVRQWVQQREQQQQSYNHGLVVNASTTNGTSTADELLLVKQMLKRLFPIQRGLVHDYWAANIWALYMAANKVVGVLNSLFVQRRQLQLHEQQPHTHSDDSWSSFFLGLLVKFFDETNVTPIHVVILLMLVLSLGGWTAWKATSKTTTTTAATVPQQRRLQQQRHRLILTSFVYSTLASFQTSYHVHEKAILTSLLPMIPLCLISFAPNNNDPDDDDDDDDQKQKILRKGGGGGKQQQLAQPKVKTIEASSGSPQQQVFSSSTFAMLLWELNAWGLLGLFPLLFEPREFLLKITSYLAYMSALYHVCFLLSPATTTLLSSSFWATWWIRLNILAICTVVVILEIIPLSVWGRWEFVPLAITSVTCALALGLATVRLAYHLLRLV